jgi:hypothetical protein
MPKRQPTAAKKARVAARRGAKFTLALREQQAKTTTPPLRERPYRAPTVFDIIGSSAFKAVLDAVNSPAMQAAHAAAQDAIARVNSPAMQAAHAAAQDAIARVNSPAMQVLYRRWTS